MERNLKNLHNAHLFIVCRDIEDEEVGYWVYIKLFNEDLNFQTGDFRECLYTAPLITPDQLGEENQDLILSDVELSYSIVRTAFEDNDDEYMSSEGTTSHSSDYTSSQSGSQSSNSNSNSNSRSGASKSYGSSSRGSQSQSDMSGNDVRNKMNIKDIMDNIKGDQSNNQSRSSKQSGSSK